MVEILRSSEGSILQEATENSKEKLGRELQNDFVGRVRDAIEANSRILRVLDGIGDVLKVGSPGGVGRGGQYRF